MTTDVARGQLLMLLSGEFLGFAGRAVGLDSVQVSRGLGSAASDFDLLATESDPSARLTVARRLSRQAEIIVSQSLRESGDITWIMSYRPGRDVTLRATTNDDGSGNYEFRHELVFGAAPGFERPGSSSGRPGPVARVADVGFTGAPGVDERDLRALLRLRPGDRFNFYRWQQDRDRLLAWYHDHDFLEARVAARRQETPEAPDAGVVLEYDIERGPSTTLTVDGYALAGDVVARMREAWGNAVFDGFLLEDLQTTAREALVGDGYLQARVTAAVVSSPGASAKEISVHLDPGRRFGERRLSFSGNEHVSDDELAAAVEAAGLATTVWTSPATLGAALERFYRARGYLAATVTPGQPVFEDDSATLPVRIEEGEPFRIGEVRVQGGAALPEEEIRAAVGLAPGAPYVPAEIEPARRRVEADYLQRAYNDVRVSAATDVERDRARVNVTLSIDEGRRQVLSAVEVGGAEVTARGVIDRALELKPGEPVALTEIYRAQKGLYDTGVFQSADVTLEPAPDGNATDAVEPVRAVVTLQEVPRYRFRYGFRMNNEVAPVEPTRQVRPAFVADLLRRNLFGRAMSAGVAGQLESDRRLARGYLSLPSLLGREVVTNVFATASRVFFPPANEFDLSIVERVNEFTLEQRFRPARQMAVSYGYSFTRKHNFEVDRNPDSVLPPYDVAIDIGRLTGAYAWDTRDDPSNAHRGWFHSSGLEFGSQALGSDLRFVKYLAQDYYFRPVGRQVVLASALRLGLGRGFGDQDLDVKFHAGGGTTVRGFAEDSLGPADFFGPLGGNALLVLNQEVRFPIYKWLRGVSFLDAGNVFPKARDLSVTTLEVGTGVGLRVESPFVLFRVDFGMPVTHREEQPGGRWYFAIGHTF